MGNQFLPSMKTTLLLCVLLGLTTIVTSRTFTIGSSRSNERCVRVSKGTNWTCPKSCGKSCRKNTDFKNAPDTFDLTVKDGKICAKRTDAKGKGWGMHLRVACAETR